MALQGNTDLEIAALCDKTAHAAALIADDDGGRAAQVRAGEGRVTVGCCAEHPDAAGLQVADRGDEVRNAGHGHIFERTGRSLADDGRQADAAAILIRSIKPLSKIMWIACLNRSISTLEQMDLGKVELFILETRMALFLK